MAKINPKQPIGTIPLPQLNDLCLAIRDVLTRAIEAGGSSLKDHVQVDGKSGYFQHQFHVYNQTGMGCSLQDCNGEISQFKQSGRSTFYCPKCQGEV
jgi:formamidopyrimidine-DNA glycosylase